MDERDEEEIMGIGEGTSTQLPQVPDADYLNDLAELQNQWKSTNTQSLGELWYYLFKQVSSKLVYIHTSVSVENYSRVAVFLYAVLISLHCLVLVSASCTLIFTLLF